MKINLDNMNIDTVWAIKERANKQRTMLFDKYGWEQKPPFTDGDIKIVLSSAEFVSELLEAGKDLFKDI